MSLRIVETVSRAIIIAKETAFEPLFFYSSISVKFLSYHWIQGSNKQTHNTELADLGNIDFVIGYMQFTSDTCKPRV